MKALLKQFAGIIGAATTAFYGMPATAADSKAWRDAYKLEHVISLYDTIQTASRSSCTIRTRRR